MKNPFSLSLKWLLKSKNVITVTLTVFITLISFYNSALIYKIEDGKQKVFEKIVKLGAINSSYAGNLSYINLLLANIQDCRAAKNLENDLLRKMCSSIQNSYEREIAREGEFIDSIEGAQKELNISEKEYLLIEIQNRFLVLLTEFLFYIFSAIIIIINVSGFRSKGSTKKQ